MRLEGAEQHPLDLSRAIQEQLGQNPKSYLGGMLSDIALIPGDGGAAIPMGKCKSGFIFIVCIFSISFVIYLLQKKVFIKQYTECLFACSNTMP